MKRITTPLKAVSIKYYDLTELDFDFENKYVSGLNIDDGKLRHTEFIFDNTQLRHSTPIDINLLKDKIDELKMMGADYVLIAHDVDHHGYLLEGMRVEKPTVDEIKKNELKKNELKELEEQHSKLKKELGRIEKKYQEKFNQ
ncbi:MAG: hypothetical protein ACOCVF_00955 [bacterium]